MASNDTDYTSFLSSLIQDIKSYSGSDPLLPWLRGMKKMKETLPSDVLKEKLPRFLQKCTRTFQSDRRYKNDLRYLRVWLHLMDYMDDPKVVLRTMEENRIGVTRALFYQAYALYYEKLKKFDDAEKMYCLGVENLAEPADELKKSYEQFLHRLERHKKKKTQHERRSSRRPLSSRSIPLDSNEEKENSENMCRTTRDQNLEQSNHKRKSTTTSGVVLGNMKTGQVISKQESDDPRMFRGEDTMVVGRFVKTAIVGQSETENACHHGLVEPTVNTKEAMNAINDMFREPIETVPIRRKSNRSQTKEDKISENGLNVFVDENLDNGRGPTERKEEKRVEQEPFKIFVDDEGSDETVNRNDEEEQDVQKLSEGSSSSGRHINGFVFPNPKDLSSESSDDMDGESSPPVKLREDTVVHRFVGSTILDDEPVVENVCHHGLVDPTINLKEAMNDINNMFGKPIDFVRAKRPKTQQEKPPVRNQDLGGFSILPDDDLETKSQARIKSSSKSRNGDLFEPTMFTKEAIDDINKMFGMPLDF